MIKSKDGAPMKMGTYPPLARETVRYVGQPFAVVVAETRCPGARCRGSRRGRLGGAARR
jgi:CO/xanthine dehydrogenase Mo-binding subunit